MKLKKFLKDCEHSTYLKVNKMNCRSEERNGEKKKRGKKE